MSKPETIKIDDVKYIRANSVDDAKKYEDDIKIIIADRGFVIRVCRSRRRNR